MKKAIFGGSFNPIHYGHLLLAETARVTCGLDEIIFMPAGIPPHKQGKQTAPGLQRFQMIQNAIADCPEFSVSRFEIDSPAVSYTIHTVRHFRKIMPNDEFFLLVGSETLADMAHWYEAAELCRSIDVIAAYRAGFPRPDLTPLIAVAGREKVERWTELVVPMPEMGISSTLIRDHARTGTSLRFLTPTAVQRYIIDNHLYTE